MNTERTAYDEKLKSILRAAANIFAQKGYHQASIRDIARATRVSLSGLYYYFSSKEELLFLIYDHAFGTLLRNLEQLLAGVEDPHRRIRLFIENYVLFFVNNTAEMKVLTHEAGTLTGEYLQRVNAQKRQLTQMVLSILKELKPDSDLDQRVAALGLFGMMNWIYNWYRPGRDVPPERLAEDMSRLFLSGFLQAGDALPLGARAEAASEPQASIWGDVASEA